MHRENLKSANPLSLRIRESEGVLMQKRISDHIRIQALYRWHFLWLVVLFAMIPPTNASFAEEPVFHPFRVGFSSSMFTDVNENDARAATKIWGQTIVRDKGLPFDVESLIIKNDEELFMALKSHQVDAVAITAIEYEILHKHIDFNPVFVTLLGGNYSEQYVLLAHRDGQVKHLADLRGSRLLFHWNARLFLASMWLNTILNEHGFKPSSEFTDKITKMPKLAQAVLPVFFRQADACIVTRSGFETMTELNPQVGRQLAIITSSKEMVPAVFAFRSDYMPPQKESLIESVRKLHTTPAGQQVLTIFSSDKIEEHPISVLDSAMDLIAKHRKINGPGKQGNIP